VAWQKKMLPKYSAERFTSILPFCIFLMGERFTLKLFANAAEKNNEHQFLMYRLVGRGRPTTNFQQNSNFFPCGGQYSADDLSLEKLKRP
jgi:hypothetical protein